MEIFENILLVSGRKRNVGKTTFICNIISLLQNKDITAVKITPHFHEVTLGLQSILKGEAWHLYKETNSSQEKDTSLYLKAGASESYFLQTKKENLVEAFKALLLHLPKNNPTIIESAGLIDIIKPGIFVVILPDGECLKKEIESKLMVSDLIVISDGKIFYPPPQRIGYDNRWLLKTNK